MKNKKIILIFLSFMALPLPALADPTGATNAAMLAKLTEMLRTANEQMRALKEQLDVAKNMEGMQQNALVKELTETGSSLGEMFQEMRVMERQIEGFQEDPYGTRQIENDIYRIQQRAEYSEDQHGLRKGESYAEMLRSLNRVKWLGKATGKNEEKMAAGMSESDATKLSAENLAVINRLLLEQEMRKTREDVLNTEILTDFIGGINYGGMGLMATGK